MNRLKKELARLTGIEPRILEIVVGTTETVAHYLEMADKPPNENTDPQWDKEHDRRWWTEHANHVGLRKASHAMLIRCLKRELEANE